MAQRQIGDVVRRKPVTLPGSATVQQACQAMNQHRIGAVLVVDGDGRLEGIFTGRDVVRLLADGKNPGHTRLESVMTHKPEHMPPSHTAIDALRLMHDGGFRHVPVVADGCVVGIVSAMDFRAVEHDRLDEESGFWERI
ncbi:MAG: CBS domain-containing protein [Acetobacteraceae bacterium]|nr:CBS domain-containing protein [Acetobacteraceae bacterium]